MTALFFISWTNLRALRKFTNVPNEVVHLFVDTKRYGKVKSDLDSTNISCFARPHYLKGTDILVNAFKAVKKRYPKTELFVGGEGPLKNKYNYVSGVHMLGFCRPEDYLKKSGLYINPSRLEPFGVNILEAMCAGIPPIVTEFCGAKEIVAKVDKSLIVKCSPDAIAKKAIELIENHDRKRIGMMCKREAMKYTLGRCITEVRKKFKNIINSI